MLGYSVLPASAQSITAYDNDTYYELETAYGVSDDSEPTSAEDGDTADDPVTYDGILAGTTLCTVDVPSGEDIIARALYLSELGAKYSNNRYYNYGSMTSEEITENVSQYGLDCSELVMYTLATLGVQTEGFFGSDYDYWTNTAYTDKYGHIPNSTHGWNTNGYNIDGINSDVYWKTADGSKIKIRVIKNGEYTWDLPYYLMQNGDTIPVGSIVLGLSYNSDNLSSRRYDGDHMWIYMGEFDQKADVKDYVAYLTGKSTAEQRSKIANMWASNDKYWRIESTGTDHGFGQGRGVQINDHINNANYKAGDAKYYKVYVFAPPTDAESNWKPSENNNAMIYSNGEVNGDGMVTVTDISLTAAHIKGIKQLTGHGENAADVNKNGNIDVTDLSLIAAHVKGLKEIQW